MDTLTSEQRSAIMGLVTAKDTRPEFAVRRVAWSLGFRYRLHPSDVPGRPDLMFRSLRKVVLVHGCFWHRHTGCARTRTPKSRIDFWQNKFRRNVERDRVVRAALRREGWKVLVIWECQTENPTKLRKLLSRFLEVGR